MSPIKNPDLYPADWQEIALFIKESNWWQCQACGRQCTKPGEAYRGGRETLTVAHLFHDYLGAEIFVAALCGPCHLRHDAPFGAMLRARHPRWRQGLAGQLALMEGADG